MTDVVRKPPPLRTAGPAADHARIIAAVASAVSALRFGDIRLTVHDGRVVQMETTEKHRF